jgi:hypothetical protein
VLQQSGGPLAAGQCNLHAVRRHVLIDRGGGKQLCG